jgi:pyridoxal/pyridoxine/pyridoxamine kinase
MPASTHASTSELARFVKVWYFVVFIAECEIFLTGYFQNQEAVMKFSKDNVSDCEEILSTQEEADIRIILQQ